MPLAQPDRVNAAAGAPGKPRFAKRARDFAKRAVVAPPPGFPILQIGCLGAAGLMIITGGFGTDRLPLAERGLFWLLLMGWNACKWQLWFAATVRRAQDWPRASLLGTLPLNLVLPVEIALCGAAIGVPMRVDPLETWGSALGISALIVGVAALLAWVLLRKAAPAPPPATDGLLTRARVAPEALAAIQAEDHYCRVRTRDGRSALVHYRFGDALAEMAAIDGIQVHRGAWVAEGAVTGAAREGRRWRLLLADGSAVPVSDTYAAEVRRRQWLRPGAQSRQ